MPATAETPRPATAPRPEDVLPPEHQSFEDTPYPAKIEIDAKPRTSVDPEATDERLFSASGTVVGPEVNKIKPASADFERLDLRQKSRHTSVLDKINGLARRTGNTVTKPDPKDKKGRKTIEVPNYTNLHVEQEGELLVVTQQTEREKEVPHNTKKTWLPHFYIKENVGTDKFGRPKGGLRIGRYELTERAHTKHGLPGYHRGATHRENGATFLTPTRKVKYEPKKTTEEIVTIKVYNKDGSVKAIEDYTLEEFDKYLRGEAGRGLPRTPAEKAWWPDEEVDGPKNRIDILSKDINDKEYVRDKDVRPGKNAKKHLLDVILDKQVKEELDSLQGLKWINGYYDYQVLDDSVVKKQLGVGKGFKTARHVYIQKTDVKTGRSTFEVKSMDEFRGYFDDLAVENSNLDDLRYGRAGRSSGLWFDAPEPPTPEAPVPLNNPDRLRQEEAIKQLAEQTLGSIYPGPRSDRPSGLTEKEERERREQRKIFMAHMAGKLVIKTNRWGTTKKLSAKASERWHEHEFNETWKKGNIKEPTQAELDKQQKERVALFLLTSAEEFDEKGRTERIQQMVGLPAYQQTQRDWLEALDYQQAALDREYAGKKFVDKSGRPDKMGRMLARQKLEQETAEIAQQRATIQKDLQKSKEGYKLVEGLQKLIDEKGLPEVLEMGLRMQRDYYAIMKDANMPVEGENSHLSWTFQFLAEQSYHTHTKDTLHNETREYVKKPTADIPGMMIGDPFEQTKAGRDRVRQLVGRKVGEAFAKRHLEASVKVMQTDEINEKTGKPKLEKQVSVQISNANMKKVPAFVRKPLEKLLKRGTGEGKDSIELEPATYAAIGDLIRRAVGRHGPIEEPYYPS